MGRHADSDSAGESDQERVDPQHAHSKIQSHVSFIVGRGTSSALTDNKWERMKRFAKRAEARDRKLELGDLDLRDA